MEMLMCVFASLFVWWYVAHASVTCFETLMNFRKKVLKMTKTLDFADSGAHLMALGEHCILSAILWPIKPTLGMPGTHWGMPACIVGFL